MTENPLRREYWLGTVDPRPLALFRLLFGTVVLFDLLQRSPDVRIFLSDEGFAPRATSPWLSASWSLFRLVGSPPAVMMLYLAGCASVVAVLVGYRTRLAQVAMFVFLASLAARDPSFVTGPDHFIGVMSFWLLFADSGAVWSVDWLRHGRETRAVPALALRLLQWQFGVVLFFASEAKWAAWGNGLGIYHITQYRDWITPLGATFMAWPAVCIALNWMVISFEVAIPLLLIALAPLAPRWCRAAGVLAGSALFIGMFCFVRVGSYPELLLAGLTLFALPEWLDRLGLGSRPAEVRPPITASRWIPAALGGAQLAVIIWSLIAARSRLPEGDLVREELQQLNLVQIWLMFARPMPFSPRWTDTGTLSDGSQREILSEVVPQVLAWPPTGDLWRNTRQRMMAPSSEPFRQSFVNYVCREFNRLSPVPLVGITLELHGQAMHDPGEQPTEERILHAYRHSCESAAP